jgi:hypothetical protein
MKRRHFIGGSSAALLVPVALRWPESQAFATSPHDFAFFDDRFEKARQIAASWPTSASPVAVQGDITGWREVLDRATRERPLLLRGVTTESFRFCAAIVAGDQAKLELQLSRLDRNLVFWTMRTTPKYSAERSHG